MKKVQQEVKDFTGKKGSGDKNDVQKLVKAAMRLHPPCSTLLPNETIDKCVICGYQIEAKTSDFVNAHAIGREPESYENPDKFLPERFMNSSIDFKSREKCYSLQNRSLMPSCIYIYD